MHSCLSMACGAAVALAMSMAPALAYTTPFTFHCRGNACRAVTFFDEGNGCTVVSNRSARNVHITQGDQEFDLAPGETYSKLQLDMCFGYYDGGETATFR